MTHEEPDMREQVEKEAREIVYQNFMMRGAFKELAEVKTKESEHLVDLITTALLKREMENEALKKRVEELEIGVFSKDFTIEAAYPKAFDEIKELQSQLQEAREIIKHIHCECCIGNPMVGKHDDYCIKAKAWMGKYGSHV